MHDSILYTDRGKFRWSDKIFYRRIYKNTTALVSILTVSASHMNGWYNKVSETVEQYQSIVATFILWKVKHIFINKGTCKHYATSPTIDVKVLWCSTKGFEWLTDRSTWAALNIRIHSYINIYIYIYIYYI